MCAHKNPILDLAWNPFNDNEIASSSEDCNVMLFDIPDAGFTDTVETAKTTLSGHGKKVLLRGNVQS